MHRLYEVVLLESFLMLLLFGPAILFSFASQQTTYYVPNKPNTYTVVTSNRTTTDSSPTNSVSYKRSPSNLSNLIQEHLDLYRDFHQDPSWTIGRNFTVRINIHNASNVYGWQAFVTFDPYSLVVIGVEAGDFLSQDILVINCTNVQIPENPELSSGDSVLLHRADLAPGTLLMGGCRLGDVPGKYGSGTLATVTFGVWSHITQPDQDVILKETILVSVVDQDVTVTNQGSLTIEE